MSALRKASTHWQCRCGNAGCKGRICDLCGTPFEWEPTLDDWVKMEPLPGETWEEHMAEFDRERVRAREGLT